MIKEKLNNLMRWARSEDMDFDDLNERLERALERIQVGLGKIQAASELSAATAKQMKTVARSINMNQEPAVPAEQTGRDTARVAALSEDSLNTQVATLDVALERMKTIVARLEELEREREPGAGETTLPFGETRLPAERLHGMIEGLSQEVTRRVTERMDAAGLKLEQRPDDRGPQRFSTGVTLN